MSDKTLMNAIYTIRDVAEELKKRVDERRNCDVFTTFEELRKNYDNRAFALTAGDLIWGIDKEYLGKASVRTCNCVHAVCWRHFKRNPEKVSLAEFCSLGEHEVKSTRGVGVKVLNEIRGLLAEYGLALGSENGQHPTLADPEVKKFVDWLLSKYQPAIAKKSEDGGHDGKDG